MCRLTLLISILGVAWAGYDPTWESLDTRPLPPWYDGAKIGIMICWGLYSVPSFGNEWFWNAWQSSHSSKYVKFMEENFKPNFTYQDFAAEFTAEFYDPAEWARLFNASGARYTVFVSKHHEGYTMWPSRYSWNWNSMDVGPKRDLFGDLTRTMRSTTPHIHVGVYHSLYEWYNPLYLEDKNNHYMTNDFVSRKTLPELYELVKDYQPEVIWSDGDWEAKDWYWNSTIFLAWLFNESPVKDTVVVNDRWGAGTACQHGSFYNCQDRYNPGNLLVNVGPTHDGRIPPIMEERLRQLGSWLDINGDAVYDSTPWVHQNDTVTPGVWYTLKGDLVYSIVLIWPKDNTLTLGSVQSTPDTTVTMLGYSSSNLQFKDAIGGLSVTFPPMSQVTSQWVWVLAMSGINPAQTSNYAGH
ncbi:alpha-L-fucosidase-like isoform X4 [Cherax quadricarinatus]|uniref:alpha-L-fucosidase-like isoform X4 n=1 Tax=Cherax quadricarinatus TaxID=27406 RepID=UPI00387E8D7F